MQKHNDKRTLKGRQTSLVHFAIFLASAISETRVFGQSEPESDIIAPMELPLRPQKEEWSLKMEKGYLSRSLSQSWRPFLDFSKPFRLEMQHMLLRAS
jgi:hypothetical protein